MAYRYSIQINDPTRAMDLCLENPLPKGMGDISRYIPIMNMDKLIRINETVVNVAVEFSNRHPKLSIFPSDVYIIADNRVPVIAVIVYDRELKKTYCAGEVIANTTENVDMNAGPYFIEGTVADVKLEIDDQ